MADGFLGRWSRRKLGVKEERIDAPSAPVIPAHQPAPVIPAEAGIQAAREQASPLDPRVRGDDGKGRGDEPQPPLPTLSDTESLTPQSDFRPFLRADVGADVKNAALKKLFTDPHFNRMDGLDVYIDDYGKPDPLPQAMLRKLASAAFMGMVSEDEPKEAHAAAAQPEPRDGPCEPPTASEKGEDPPDAA